MPTGRRSVRGLHAFPAEPEFADPAVWGRYLMVTHDLLGAVPQRQSASGVVSSTRTIWAPLAEQKVLACASNHRVQLSPARCKRLAAEARRSGLAEVLVDG